MEIAEYYGDSGMMNPRSIDPLVYMLVDMAEGRFGPEIVDEKVRNAVALSNAGAPKSRTIALLADRLIRHYLAEGFRQNQKTEMAATLKNLPPLTQASYVDYFVMIIKIEREAFRTPLASVTSHLSKVLLGYQTESPFPICEAIVDFFWDQQNPEGMRQLIGELAACAKLKVNNHTHKKDPRERRS